MDVLSDNGCGFDLPVKYERMYRWCAWSKRDGCGCIQYMSDKDSQKCMS